jgi:ADP-ribosylglycohydrolase
MDAVAVGKAGLQGWRGKMADAVAEPVARRSGLTHDQVRAAVGAIFLALSVLYVVGAARRLAGGAR